MRMCASGLIAAFTACALIIGGCTKATDPSDPDGSDKTAVAVSALTGFPTVGGNATCVSVNPDGSVIAIIDRKLYTLASATSEPTLVNATATHIKLAVAPTDEIYAVTDTEFRTYANAGATANAVPIPANGPLVANGRVDDAKITFSPSGIPFVTLVSNYPRSYIYYSTDKGQSWQALKLPGSANYIGSSADLAFLPNGDLVVAVASYFGGLNKTTDLGTTWTKLAGTIPDFPAKMLVAANGNIYTWVPGGGQLRVSKDGGSSFETLTPNNAYPFFTHVIEGAGNVLYGLAGTGGFLRSINGGATWTEVIAVHGSDVATRGSTVVIAKTEDIYRKSGGLFTSVNSGFTWTQSGLRTMESLSSFGFDKDNNLIVLGDESLFRRVGSAWNAIGSNSNFRYLATTPKGQILVGTTAALSYSGDNGATWIQSKDLPGYIWAGQGEIRFPVVLGKRNGDFLISVTTYRFDLSIHVNGALYKVGASGLPVKILTGPSGPVTRITEDINGILYAGTSESDANTQQSLNQVFKSVDGGETWQKTGDGTSTVLAFNSQNTALSLGGETGFTLGPLGSSSPRQLTFTGFTGLPQSIFKAQFTSDDKLYFIESTKGIFISQAAVR